ncbi:unnamed protein product [Effrenium voratum]|uniref:Uncharacterized protein n=1 Tax=Effrenium voratum TaxID=2562239 RepID=A0AA36IH44_9DINO|nr:unnamed protein product [Effrenium voratum]
MMWAPIPGALHAARLPAQRPRPVVALSQTLRRAVTHLFCFNSFGAAARCAPALKAGGSRPSRGSDVEVHMESYTAWRSRQDFETSEGFIVHATKHLASQWLQWLRDGSLTKQAHLLEPDARKVLLSEQAARGAVEQVRQFCQRLGNRGPSELTKPLEEFCSCIGAREYAKASKAYMDIVMGARKWQGDVPYLVEAAIRWTKLESVITPCCCDAF